MAIDKRHLGRRYGPYRFSVGEEHLRDFAFATGGGVPGRVFGAPPGFCATFAIQPFSAACSDPELGIDVLRLLHGGQELELFGPVRAGDLLTTTGEITRLQDRANLDVLDVTTRSVNQRGELVVRAVWTAVIRG